MKKKTHKIVSFVILMHSLGYSQMSVDIKQALQTAKDNNPVLKSEQLNVKIAEADIVTAKLRPNLKLNNQSLQSTNSANYAPNTSWNDGKNRQVWWQLTKQFQIAGQRSKKIDLANKSKVLTEAGYTDFQRNLLTDVAMSWLDTWMSQKKWQSALLAKNNWDTLVNINRNRLKNQVITATDLNRTELLANQYNVIAQTAKLEYLNKINDLRFLLGVDQTITIPESETIELFDIDTEEKMLQQALEERSDIKVLKSAIEASKSNISLQKSLAYPQPELGVIYNPQNTIPYAGIYATVDLPFFDRNQGEIRKSETVKDKTEQELTTAKTRLKTEIANAFASYQMFEQNMNNLKQMKENSNQILASVKYAYLKGGTTLIDFLDAQRMWFETQQNYYDAVYKHKEGLVRLLYTTGLINKTVQ